MQDDCWLYAKQTVKGYGRLTVWNGQRYERYYVHRVMYEVLVGHIPDGKVLDHLCRTPQCINPAHLEPVSNGENLLRGVGVGAINAKKTHCSRGHEFTPKNTYVYPSGKRKCRACHRQDTMRFRAKAHAKSTQAIRGV